MDRRRFFAGATAFGGAALGIPHRADGAAPAVPLAGDSFLQSGTGAVARSRTSKLGEWVSVKDFGAAGDGTTDDTKAINHALAAGRHVLFPPGTYLTTGGHVQATAGQRVFGSGHMFPGLAGTGVTIKKKSGNSVLWSLNGHNGSLENVMLDNNSLGGNALRVNTKYLLLKNLILSGQGGRDFAMQLNSVNSCLFENIHFPDGNFGNILTEGASALLYSTFVNVTMGTVTGAYAIDLANCFSTTFAGLFLENPLRIGSTCENLNFLGLSWETEITRTKLIEVNAATAVNINFDGVRVLCNGNRTVALFDIAKAQGVHFRNVNVQDLVSKAPIVFALDTTRDVTIRDVICYMGAAFDLVKCNSAGGTNTNVTLDNVNEINSAVGGTCRWVAQGLEVRNSGIAQAFYPGAFKRIAMSNVYGAINTANVDSAALVSLTACDLVTDAGLAVLTDCTLANGQRVTNGRSRTTELKITPGASIAWAGAVPAGAIVKGVLCRVTQAITGGTGFTGFSVGHNWATPGTDPDAWGANLSPKLDSTSRPDHFTIEPICNRNNRNGDVVLTAAGANFNGASGRVRVTVFYDLMGNATS